MTMSQPGSEVSVRRSVLACPASAPEMMAKAAAGEADQVVFDLKMAVLFRRSCRPAKT